MNNSSYLEREFDLWLRTEPGLPEYEREYKFHPSRRWRFDFAFVPQRVAIEIEGGIYSEGRHTRGRGFVQDLEKYEAALRLGWKVYRVAGVWIIDGKEAVWRPQVMETIQELLGLK